MAVSVPGRVLAEVDLSDMSKGMWRAGNREDAPPGSAYDITNGLIQDDGRVARRAGSAYKSTSAFDGTNPILALWDGTFSNAGNRTLFATTARLGVLGADDQTPVSLNPSFAFVTSVTSPVAFVKVGNVLALPIVDITAGSTAKKVTLYGGSRKAVPGYGVGTVSISSGSRVLTGVGTSWTANVDTGMILNVTGFTKRYLVQSVDSNTQITLEDIWTESAAAGASYGLNPTDGVAPTSTLVPVPSSPKIASIANRLAVAAGAQIGLSDIGNPWGWSTGNYLRFPGTVLGMANIRETLLVFTTGGMYTIGGLANATPSDVSGNAAWTYQLANPELICWSHEAIGAYQGRAIVPCLDGIWMVDPTSGPRRISDNIRNLYLSYVRTSGYRMGVAATHNGHYFASVLDGSNNWIDTLVCRLDTQAWTHLAGNGAKLNAFASRRSSPTVLLGGDNGSFSRVYSLAYFQPSTALKADHDSTAHVLDITTRDVQGPGDQQNLFERIRAWWTGTVDSGSPTVGATAQRLKDGSPTTLQGSSGATYTAISDGSTYNWWDVSKMGKQIRFRITTSGSLSTFVLNKLIALILPSAGE